MSQIIFSDGPLIMASLKKEAHINGASPSHRGGVCVWCAQLQTLLWFMSSRRPMRTIRRLSLWPMSRPKYRMVNMYVGRLY